MITRKIGMARQDVVMFKDNMELQCLAIERLNNYYKELEDC